jgi:hypothetical protein
MRAEVPCVDPEDLVADGELSDGRTGRLDRAR